MSRRPDATPWVVRQVREAADALDLARRSRELDRSPSFPWKEFRELGRRRLLGLATPARFGGRGLPLPTAALALRELAYLGGTTFAKLALQPEFCGVLAEHGSTSQRTRSFAALLRGERLIGNHITEPGAGSDALGISASATAVRGGYLLDGTKSQAAFAVDAEEAIVYARTASDQRSPGRMSAFLVPQDLDGVSRGYGSDLGERWMRRGTVTYDAVRVPATARIGREGSAFGYLQEELTRDRLLLAAIYIGVARASLDETVRYTADRVAFGRPLHEHEAVGFPLVEDRTRLDAAWAHIAQTAERLQEGGALVGEAAMAKWMATDVALTAIDHAIQFHGGLGYSQSLPHEQRWRDVRSGAIAHGPSEIMHRVAARSLWPRTARPTARPSRRSARRSG